MRASTAKFLILITLIPALSLEGRSYYTICETPDWERIRVKAKQ